MSAPSGVSHAPDPVALLREHLGYPGFRPGQEPLVRAVLGGRDALGVLPTGGGKSVCYQVPAHALGGLTLVVTPLLSLMEDQVGRALEAGLRAAHLSAAQSAGERSRIGRDAAAGRLDVLFVAPERLDSTPFRAVLAEADVRLLAIDEAHCISEWGHDFRPAYRRIGVLRSVLGCPALALTATATPEVRSDIRRSLRLADPLLVVRSFDRPNLSWAVRRGGSVRERLEEARRSIRRAGGCAIVYAPTRRAVEHARRLLAGWGVPAEAYHAGLSGPERSRVQASFMENRCRVVAATNAFGMGVDKPDVRLVVHLQLPATLESYYQEAGRGGRDGGPALCLAFHRRGDTRLARGFIDRTHPPARALRRLHRRLRARSDPSGVVTLDPDAERWLPDDAGAWLAGDPCGPLGALERAGALRRIPGLSGTHGGPAGSDRDQIGVRQRLDIASIRRHRRRALQKLASVERFARTRSCRRRALLGYFGEAAPAACGRCDRCAADLE